MEYSFNAQIARQYGVDGAIFIHSLHWWIVKNRANGRHYYDGRWWTYNTVDAFTKLFPFWTPKQLRRIIDKLKSDGVLYTGNYNDQPFDRTQWYALDDAIFTFYGDDFGGISDSSHLPKRANPICPNGQISIAQMGKPIPVNIPVNIPVRERGGFVPPTPAEVLEFCKKEGLGVDAQRFVAYYQANGWMIGKSKMVDWRAAVRAWSCNEHQGRGRPGKRTPAASIVDRPTPSGNDILERRRRPKLKRDD